LNPPEKEAKLGGAKGDVSRWENKKKPAGPKEVTPRKQKPKFIE
jgi:hypothetical protein